MFKFGQITVEDVSRAQRGDEEALSKVLTQSFPLVSQLLLARKYIPQIKTKEELQSLVENIREFIKQQVIPSYSEERGDFNTFLWDSVKSFLGTQSRKHRGETGTILDEDVIAAKEGDRTAMDFVIQNLEPMMKAIITRHPKYVWWVKTKEDMEDLLQHLQEHIFSRGIPTYDPARGGKATTYFYKIIVNELILEGQKAARRQRQTGGPEISLDYPPEGAVEVDEPLSGIVPDPRSEMSFLPHLFDVARSHMSDFDRTVLDMKLQGWKSEEIVTKLKQEGVTTPTGKELDPNWLNVHFNTKIKPILRQYVYGIPPEQPEQKLPFTEPLPEDLSEEASRLSLYKEAEMDIITFLRLFLFESK